MLSYIVAGLALGGLYAVSAAGVVATYVSTGVLNFAFASEAYFVGRFYYFLNSQHGWATWTAGLVSIVVVAPLLGLLLWAILFRLLSSATQTTKIVATIGLSVAIPALATVIFGNTTFVATPGLAPLPVKTFTVFGATLTLDQLIAYVAAIAVLVGGSYVLLRTTAGLRVRAVVDSEAMTSLSGVNPLLVSAGVWTVTTFLAGLVGVLAAPLIGLDSGNYLLLIVAAFAAVVAAQLRSLPIAVGVGVLMGIVGSLCQWLLPTNDPITADILPSVPFAFIVIFLLYHSLRRSSTRESEKVGGPLDAAIRINDQAGSALAGARRHPGARRGGVVTGLFTYRNVGAVIVFVVLTLFVSQLGALWSQLVALAAIYGVIFMSYTLVTGSGGMIWVCQISFAGVGALTTGQLAGVYNWPLVGAIVVGALIAGAMGLLLGALTIRLGDLYVVLATLALGLLLQYLVFQREVFYQLGSGQTVPRPNFAASNTSFDYFALAIAAVAALTIGNMNRSSLGLALAAVRSSESASRTMGLSTVRAKLFVATMGAIVAGLGGGLLASYQFVALPQAYDIIDGLVWLAVVVTMGVRSPMAAILAGVTFAYIPELFASYLPTSIAEVPTILFGVGAILVARNPGGALDMNARQIERALDAGSSLLRGSRVKDPIEIKVTEP